MSARELIDHGERYIEGGWLPFMLSASKAPLANCQRCRAEHVTPVQMEQCECLTCHGFYAATLDAGRFAEMASMHPNGLLAIRTGAPSDLAVVDVDPAGRPEMERMVRDGLLPRTLAQVTGRGHHLLYAHPCDGKIQSGAGKIAPGIDSKADSAYIVVAPSIHPATRRPYRWLAPLDTELAPLPQHLAERLREPVPQPRPVARPVFRSGRGRGYGEAALRGELEKVLALKGTRGLRNDQLNRSTFALGQLVAGGQLDRDRTTDLLEQAGERIGLRAGEIRLTVASGMRAGALYPRGGAR